MAAEAPSSSSPGAVETLGWEELWAEHLTWEPGQHISYIGPTGVGKTTALVALLEQTPQHAILVVTKRRDDLIRRLPQERGWTLARDPDSVFKALKRTPTDWWERRDRPPQRIVYYPELSRGVPMTKRAELLQWRVLAVLDRAYDRGSVTVAIDETTFAAEELGLRRPLVIMWHEGRSSKMSVVAGIQRPAYVPKSAYGASTYLGIFRTADPDDLVALGKMAGLADHAELRRQIASLPEHHHLLVNTRTGEMYVTRVVIRKRRPAAGGRRRADE